MASDPSPQIDLGRFDEVDAVSNPGEFVRWMEYQRRRGPDRLLEALDLGESSVVLDLGCGTGVDLESMGTVSSHVVGVDRSMEMLASSRERNPATPLRVANCDGHRLPFAENCFDACWARAVFIHAADPQGMFHEVARVVRPGGRVVISEPDQGSHVVATDELEIFERVKRHRSETFRQPCIGRQLGSLATIAGMAVSKVIPMAIMHRSLASARGAGGPFDVAVDGAIQAGAVTEDEGRRYLRSLEAFDRRGVFCYAALAFSIVAINEDPPLQSV